MTRRLGKSALLCAWVGMTVARSRVMAKGMDGSAADWAEREGRVILAANKIWGWAVYLPTWVN